MAAVTSSPVPPLPSADTTGGTASRLGSGLSSTEAQRRLAEFGPNEIRREQTTTLLTLLARQFASPVIWLLLGASVLSAAVGELLDAIAIGAIVVVNALIGFFQEHRAARAVMALRSMTVPRARVMRDGHSVMVSAHTVVPGDLLVLEAGDVAAADARLHSAHVLTTSERSGSEQQRVSIARALANRPPVILADEPTAPLGSDRGLAVMRILNRLTSQYQTAIIVVTHDEKISPAFKRMHNIRDGRTVEEAGEERGFRR